jgi:cell wall-associated NlpC family hydrolase
VSLDPRVTLARTDLAAIGLEGEVRAPRFAPTFAAQAITPTVAIRAAPDPSAEQVDQLLLGEVFDKLEETDGFVWGQARRDGYVGFVEVSALANEIATPSHWVSAPRTYAFAQSSIKARAFGPISMNALLTITEETETLALAAGVGWIAKAHLSPVGESSDDPAAIAESFLGAPYLWGGRTSLGLDCSGLMQQALYAAGAACPRDADQQASLGTPIGPDGLARGDLVGWRGHIGMMLDETRLIHANAHHMAVAIEPLAEAIARIAAKGGGEPTAMRRLGLYRANT